MMSMKLMKLGKESSVRPIEEGNSRKEHIVFPSMEKVW